MYEIKDLEWKQSNYHLISYAYNLKYTILNISGMTHDVKCLYGNEDENLGVFKTIEEAKAKANEHWRSVLMPFLKEVQEAKNDG